MTPADVFVIHYDTRDDLERCLARLNTHAPEARVHVLHTGPEDQAYAQATETTYGVRWLDTENHSYSHACNVAFRHCDGPICTIMNADAFIESDTLERMARPFQGERVAVTGPKIVTADGTPQRQGLPYALETRGLKADEDRDVSWISGCLFAVNMEAVADIGGFDPSLRFGNEDLEFSLRARDHGWRNVMVGATATHLGGTSTPDAPPFWVEGLRGSMLLDARRAGGLRREAHRLGLQAVALWQRRFGPERNREGWQAVARMTRRKRYDVSPFADTLAEVRDDFPQHWPPEANA